MRCHVVADHSDVDVGLAKFPGREAGSLQKGACLVGIDGNVLSLFRRRVDGCKCGAEFCRGEAACITVCKNRLSIVEQIGSVLANGAAHGGILIADAHGFLDQPFLKGVGWQRDVGSRDCPHTVKCPKEIHSSGA